MKNRAKILFIALVFAVTTPIFSQGFWSPDCTFIFGRETWFTGDTTDGHVEIHFDSSDVWIPDFAAWIDSVRMAIVAINLDSFINKYTEIGDGLYWNGSVVYVDFNADPGLIRDGTGIGLDFTNPANYDWTNETHDFDTDGYLAAGAPFYLKDSSNTNRAVINYTETTKDFITFGNSLFPTVIKGGNSTNAIEIDNGVTNINNLTLDTDLIPSYIAYDYGLTDLSSDNDLDVDTIVIATRLFVGDQGFLTSYTETDPIFSAWNKSTGISITESQISDLDHYDYWNVKIDGVQKMQVSDQESVNFEGGTHITISEPTSDKLRVDADTTGNGGLASKIWTTNQIAAAGGGDITGVTAGSGLSGGGASGTVTLSLDGADNRNYPHVSDTHNWSTSGSITAGGSLESTGGYVKSTSGFTLDDSAGTNQLIMNYVATTVDYYVFGTSSHKTVIKGASATNAIEIDASGTNINTLTLDNDLDISSYTNLAATSPVELNGDAIELNYDTDDFESSGGSLALNESIDLWIPASHFSHNTTEYTKLVHNPNYGPNLVLTNGYYAMTSGSGRLHEDFASIESIEIWYRCASSGYLYLDITISKVPLTAGGNYSNDTTTGLAQYSNASGYIQKITVPANRYDDISFSGGDIIDVGIYRNSDNSADTYNQDWGFFGVLVHCSR